MKEVGALEEPEFLDLKTTPSRVRKMLTNELLSSYQEGALERLREVFTVFPTPKGKEAALVVENGIPFYSMCAHHMIPFFGTAHVGYIPDKVIVGLSKIPRAVDFFSRKLQVQERLVDEVADFLVEVLRPKAVIVMMEARHLCMEMRGVKSAGVVTKTSALRGSAMTNPEIRQEFYTLIAS